MATASLVLNGCVELESLAEFCRVSEEKLKVVTTKSGTNSKVPYLAFSCGTTAHGVTTSACYLAKLAQSETVSCKPQLLGFSAQERADVDQWLEFRQTQILPVIFDRSATVSVLKNLNDYLEDKVYFVGTQLTLADLMIFYALHPIMSNLTCQEKEIFVHISRWFNQVQCVPGVKQDFSHVAFSRTLLYS